MIPPQPVRAKQPLGTRGNKLLPAVVRDGSPDQPANIFNCPDLCLDNSHHFFINPPGLGNFNRLIYL